MNDTKKFFKAFARDRKFFGEELTIGLYEDIYSFLLNKKVDGFDNVSSIIDEDGCLDLGIDEEQLDEGIFDTISGWFHKEPEMQSLMPSWLDIEKQKQSGEILKSADALNKALETPMGKSIVDNAAKVNAAKGPFAAIKKAGGLGGWISNSWNKIKTFFQGNTIKNMLSKGATWITNPANAAAVLGSAGGVVLLTLIIKSLKKRHQLKKYKNLQAYYDKAKEVEKGEDIKNDKDIKEAFEDNEVMNEIVEECKTNAHLHKLFYEDDPFTFETKNSYLDY